MKTTIEGVDLREAHSWTGKHAGVHFKINLWGVGDAFRLDGTWNYYLYLHEKDMPKELFTSIWLPDEMYQMNKECPIRISQDYFKVAAFNRLDLHGGITYYAKHGHIENFRTVEVGCDYAHLWDVEQAYELADVVRDVKASCERAAAVFNIK